MDQGKLVHLETEALRRKSPYTVAVWWLSFLDYGRRLDYNTEQGAKDRCAQLAKDGYHSKKSQIHCWITKDGRTEKYQYVPLRHTEAEAGGV